MTALFLSLLVLFPYLVFTQNETKITDEKLAQEFLKELDGKLAIQNNHMSLVGWAFNTDISPENEKRVVEETAKSNIFQKEVWKNASKYDWKTFKDYGTRRQFEKLSVLGIAALDEVDSKKFTNVTTEMEKNYGSATACVRSKCKLELEPDLTNIISKSRDYDELKETWVNWREAAGKPVRELYKEYVRLGNLAAVKNGFQKFDDLWLFPWETPNFKEQMETLWEEMEDLYKKLHTYVRMKLKKQYGNKMPADGTIPAHILGNMWAQSWINIQDLVVPFPNKKSVDITETLKQQNWTALQMFHLSDKFYRELGLIGMPDLFWNTSMIVKPPNKKVVCHASAWDFYDKQDFRIKMCTDVNMEELIVVHHEMGHIEYYLQYRNQPVIFREGANPGFHEAVGDLLALSVSTPGHLHKVGLYSQLGDDIETTLNYQMSKALEKIAFLPFGYLMDLYRWDIFSGKTTSEHLNRKWWELRLKYQGISPPVKRSEKDFDAGAKYHISASVEYIRYFVSFVIQFQFHKSLCSIAQPNVPLYKCDIDGNKVAGERLAKALELGSSRPWPDVMEIMTGSRNMSAKPLIEYFDPLIKYLDKEIQNETIGWKSDVNHYMEASTESPTEPQNANSREVPTNSSLLDRIETLEQKNELLGNRITKLESQLKQQQNVIQLMTTNQTRVQ